MRTIQGLLVAAIAVIGACAEETPTGQVPATSAQCLAQGSFCHIDGECCAMSCASFVCRPSEKTPM
jgi:hypothetical protein